MRNSLLPLFSLLLIGFTQALHAVVVVSDGSDGPFEPTGNVTLDMQAVAPDGVFNFTSINIPAGVVVRFVKNNLNTPVFFAATGSISIAGTIDLSAPFPSDAAGPGGGGGGGQRE